MPLRQTSRALRPSFSGVLLSILALLFCLTQLASAQSVQHSPNDEATNTPSAVAAVGDDPQQAAQANGVISGTVVDQEGAVATGAQVKLTRPGQAQAQQVLSGDDGQFSFGNVPPGPFQITVTAPGFDSK